MYLIAILKLFWNRWTIGPLRIDVTVTCTARCVPWCTFGVPGPRVATWSFGDLTGATPAVKLASLQNEVTLRNTQSGHLSLALRSPWHQFAMGLYRCDIIIANKNLKIAVYVISKSKGITPERKKWCKTHCMTLKFQPESLDCHRDKFQFLENNCLSHYVMS